MYEGVQESVSAPGSSHCSGAQGHQAQVNELADLCHSHRDMRRDAVRAKEKVEGLPIKFEKMQREWVLMQTKLAKETQNLQHKAVLWKRFKGSRATCRVFGAGTDAVRNCTRT